MPPDLSDRISLPPVVEWGTTVAETVAAINANLGSRSTLVWIESPDHRRIEFLAMKSGKLVHHLVEIVGDAPEVSRLMRVSAILEALWKTHRKVLPETMMPRRFKQALILMQRRDEE